MVEQKVSHYSLLLTLTIIIVELVKHGTSLCGTLYSSQGPNSQPLLLNDHEQLVNIANSQLTIRFKTTTNSVIVETGCQLKVCKESHFGGDCSVIKAGSYSNNNLVNPISSIGCTCPKKCDCSAIVIKKSSCGRAYFEGGCETCNNVYMDLDQGDLTFPEEFSEMVEAFKLRSGCTLTVNPNSEDEQLFANQEIVENFEGSISSYHCTCNNSLYIPRVKPPKPNSYPPMLSVPTNTRELKQLLATTTHTGLNAAEVSLRNGRSDKNAYILVLGSSGAGKSSAINILFENPTLTRVGNGASVTSSIYEFQISAPIDELGLSNTELHVIDTPGLGDTGGLTQDARFLATLDQYLSSHVELQNRIPNVVLIFHKFTDKRFSGENANFVKMLRAFDSFRNRITDDKFSNVVFVFTHFMSASRQERQKPANQMEKFQRVIQEYTNFPRPTHIVVAENKAKEEQLPKVNGYFKLPNGDFYPKNLFDKLDLITEKCDDPIGQGVLRTVFRNPENLNISHTQYSLLPSNTSKVQEYLDLLTNARLNVKDTEVTRRLQQVWQNEVNSNLKSQYQYSLPFLQKTLTLQNIVNMTNIPQSTAQILKLLSAVHQDPATKILLQKGLNIQTPHFPSDILVGFGYHVFQDKPLNKSPFRMSQLQNSDIGFMIPNSLSCSIESGSKQHFFVFPDKTKYMHYRFQSLGIGGNIPSNRFSDDLKPGSNIQQHSFRQDGCSLNAVMTYRQFKLVLNDRVDLSPEFEQAVRNLTPCNVSDGKSHEMWALFFNTYGTHVVNSAYGGGFIQLHLESDKPFDPEISPSILQLLRFSEELKLPATEARPLGIKSSKFLHKFNFTGGDPSILQNIDMANTSLVQLSKALNSWKLSLKSNPVVMATDIRLLPISRVVQRLGQNYSEEIDKAIQLWFNSDVTEYKAQMAEIDEKSPGYSREETPLLEEMAKLLEQQNEQYEEMRLKMKQEKEAMENLKEQELELQNEWAERLQRQQNERLEFQRLLTESRLESENRQKLEQTLQKMQLRFEALLEEINKLHDDKADMRWKNENFVRICRKREEIYEAEIKKRTSTEKTSVFDSVRNGCLRTGTSILMADGSHKNVENLQVGDLLLDMNFKPTRVLGVAKEFLLKQQFYGYHPNGPFFFTSNHLFVGPSNENSIQLYAVSSKNLIRNNPLMSYLNVQDMPRNVNLFQLENIVNGANISRRLKSSNITEIFQEGEYHPENTIMYDIQVDSPTGTYIANGYVCRHEIPPLYLWPNTIGLLSRLLEMPVFTKVLSALPYTVNNVYLVEETIAKIKVNIIYLLKVGTCNSILLANSTPNLTSIDLPNLEKTISGLFNSSCSSTAALRTYSEVGPVIARWLDTENDISRLNLTNTVALQSCIQDLIITELNTHFSLDV